MEVVKKKKNLRQVQRSCTADWIEFLKAESGMNKLSFKDCCRRFQSPGAARGGMGFRCGKTNETAGVEIIVLWMLKSDCKYNRVLRNQWVCWRKWSEGQFREEYRVQWWVLNGAPLRWHPVYGGVFRSRAINNIAVIKDREYCHFDQEQFSRVCERGFISVKKTNTGFDLGELSINVCFKSEFAVKPEAKILVSFNE